jgi:hypothetical protein
LTKYTFHTFLPIIVLPRGMLGVFEKYTPLVFRICLENDQMIPIDIMIIPKIVAGK